MANPVPRNLPPPKTLTSVRRNLARADAMSYAAQPQAEPDADDLAPASAVCPCCEQSMAPDVSAKVKAKMQPRMSPSGMGAGGMRDMYDMG